MTARPPGRAPRPGAPSGIVTLLTDFGLADPYVGIVKGVLLQVNPRLTVVDLTHGVPPQDVLRGALWLEAAFRHFPPGTVHLAVVDPGVGTARRPLAVLAEGHYFVGPDNGLLGFLFARPGARAVRVRSRRYQRPAPSRTFHARDVFAPVAAHLTLGVALGRLGPTVFDPVRLAWPEPVRAPGTTRGEVLLVDRFGNLLTNVTTADLPGPPACCLVTVGRTRIRGLVGTYAERPPRAVGALIDSSGRVEIFVREGSAFGRIRAGAGAAVRLRRAPAPRSGWRVSPRTRSRPPSSRLPGRWRRSRTPSSPTPDPSFAARTGSR